MKTLAIISRWILRRLLSMSLPLALVVLSFSYGVIVVAFEVPPNSHVRKVLAAGVSAHTWVQLQTMWDDENHPHIIVSTKSAGAPPVRHDPARSHTGYTLVEAFSDERFAVVLLDMDGSEQYRWRLPDEAYASMDAEGLAIERDHHDIMGTHMYDNGDLLLIVNRGGLFRLDRCSRLVWALPGYIHHDVTVEDDGSIWVLSSNYVTEQADALPQMFAPYYEDTILRISPDGKVAEEISILDAIYGSGYESLVLAGPENQPQTKHEDPVHANDIEIVDEDFAGQSDFANAGDIMVSLRTTDSIALVDRNTEKVKWALSAPFLRQHDPDLHPDGTISIFDNRTARGQFIGTVHLTEPQSFGYSRILRFDPATQRTIWKYEGSEKEPFYTSVQGDHQTLPNGNVLIVESEAGRVFEVDPADNAVVWEWINRVDRPDRDDLVGRVTRARRYETDYPQFLDRGCP